MEAKKGTTKRFRILDLLRGVAVFAMILAHSVFFLYKGENPFITGLETFGNTLCFTLFLLVSGATFYIAYFKDENKWFKKSKRLGKRILTIVLAYYALALFVSYELFIKAQGIEKLTLIFDVFTLRVLPSYTEFLPPFFIYPLLIFLFPTFIRKITKNNYVLVSFIVGLYALGALAYIAPVWDFLTPWKALISGSEGYFRFPILQYAPIYLIGLMWGKMIAGIDNIKEKKEVSHNLALTFSSAFLLTFFVYLSTGASIENILLRWPPSIPFLLFGLSLSFLISSLFYKLKLLKELNITRDIFLILGQNALGFVVAHVFILTIYGLIGGQQTDMISVLLFGFIFVILISAALTAFIPFNFKLSLTLHRHDHHEDELLENPIMELEEDISEETKEELTRLKKFFFLGKFNKGKNKKLIRKRHMAGGIMLVSLASFVMVPPITEQINITINNKNEKHWWNENYAFRQEFRVSNKQTLAEIREGSLVSFTFDHNELVSNGKSNRDGSDVSLVYWNGRNYDFLEYSKVNSFNENNSTINFKTQKAINNGSSSNPYYIYYGNPTSEQTISSSNNKSIDSTLYSIEKKPEESHEFRLGLDRKWVLIDSEKHEPSLKATLVTENDIDIDEIDIKILSSKASSTLEKTDEKTWEGTVMVSDLEPGKYEARAEIGSGLDKTYSQKVGFYVSYPLYVSWSIDWEGYNPSDANLSNLESVSNKYSLPMTHLFNPRIYVVNSISESRATYLTNWVKRRKGKGDDIGLHLHMFYDFVREAGVTVQKTPNWGDSGDGYGSLTTNYNENEMLKILNLAINLFNENGLPRPTVYRAGGWFANLDTLKALENAGIKADSSGRTSYYFYDEKGPWNLKEDAQPYYPSSLNQNSSSSPRLSILEIPNNGADSYWFSETELINRFNNLYNPSEKILTEKKQLTYLSHPTWFVSKEKNKIQPTLDEIQNYSYINDSGPIIYTTLTEVYEAWK